MNFRFYLKRSGNPLKGLEQRSARILRKHFVDSELEGQEQTRRSQRRQLHGI